MKKNIAFSIAGLAAIPLGVYFAFTSNSESQTDAITSKEDASSLEMTAPVKYIATNEERMAAQKDIGEISDELTLIMRMVEMSLQKVNIEGDKFTPDSTGRIQMTKGNIYYIKQQADSIDISRNTKNGAFSYESIINRWLEGNFDNITDEVEFLLSLTSRPYGKYDGGEVTEKTRVQEQQYIQRFFETKQSK